MQMLQLKYKIIRTKYKQFINLELDIATIAFKNMEFIVNTFFKLLFSISSNIYLYYDFVSSFNCANSCI